MQSSSGNPCHDGTEATAPIGSYTCDHNVSICLEKWEGPNSGITSFDNIGLAMLTVFQVSRKKLDPFSLVQGYLRTFQGIPEDCQGDLWGLSRGSLRIIHRKKGVPGIPEGSPGDSLGIHKTPWKGFKKYWDPWQKYWYVKDPWMVKAYVKVWMNLLDTKVRRKNT